MRARRSRNISLLEQSKRIERDIAGVLVENDRAKCLKIVEGMFYPGAYDGQHEHGIKMGSIIMSGDTEGLISGWDDRTNLQGRIIKAKIRPTNNIDHSFVGYFEETSE